MQIHGSKEWWVKLQVRWHQSSHCILRHPASNKKEKTVSVLDEAVKMVNFIKSWVLRSCLFTSVQDKMRSVRKVLLINVKAKQSSQRSSSGLEYSLSHGIPFLPEKMTDQQVGLIQFWDSADVFSEINEVGLSLQLTRLAAPRKTWVFKPEFRNMENLYSPPRTTRAPNTSATVLVRSAVILRNVAFGTVHELCPPLKDLTQWTNHLLSD